MKTMTTCKQLGGACDAKFSAGTFDEIAVLSKKHATEMHEKGDKDHLEAMREMKELMKDPKTMGEWMEAKRDEFSVLPED